MADAHTYTIERPKLFSTHYSAVAASATWQNFRAKRFYLVLRILLIMGTSKGQVKSSLSARINFPVFLPELIHTERFGAIRIRMLHSVLHIMVSSFIMRSAWNNNFVFCLGEKHFIVYGKLSNKNENECNDFFLNASQIWSLESVKHFTLLGNAG